MRLLLISGNGSGAGKDTLANHMTENTDFVIHLADGIRSELSLKYPDYLWYSLEQKYKDETVVQETGKTVRQMLIDLGQGRRAEDPTYWCQQAWTRLVMTPLFSRFGTVVAIADIRHLGEVEYFRQRCHNVTHLHVIGNGAKEEPIFDNAGLEQIADYIVRWKG